MEQLNTKIFSFLFLSGSAVICSYIYNKYFTSKETTLSSLKTQFKQHNNYLSKDIALNLMIYCIKNGNILYNTTYTSIDTKRREQLNKSDNAYYDLCYDTMTKKQMCYDQECLKVIEQFEGKFAMKELLKISGGIPPLQLSHLLYQYDVPLYEGSLPSVERSVEVYKFYVEKVREYLHKEGIDIEDSKIFEDVNVWFYKFYYLNLKINDMIYIKYDKLNDQIVKYVLRVNNMFDNKEIKLLKHSIKNYDCILMS